MKKYLLIIPLLLFATSSFAKERWVLTTPVTKPSQQEYEVQSITINFVSTTIDVVLLEPTTGETLTCPVNVNNTPGIRGQINSIVKANLAGNGNSLEARVFNLVQGTGCLPGGSRSGNPD